MKNFNAYYDSKKERRIDRSLDCCELSEWYYKHNDYSCGIHPLGFPVFLQPNKLESSDEYRDFDPYSVEMQIDSEFHRRRIDLTVKLVIEASALLAKTPTILDIGCGQGHITERIRCEIPGAAIYGLDYSLSAIEYAAKNFREIQFAVGDAYELPYSSGFFDVIVCNNIWEHVPDPLLLLSRLRRTLKNGGYLIISTPSRYRLSNLLRVMTGRSVVFMSAHHVTEYSVGQVKEQLSYGGFEVLSILSKSLSAGGRKSRILGFFIQKIVSTLCSHHQIESTVFYFAQKKGDKSVLQ